MRSACCLNAQYLAAIFESGCKDGSPNTKTFKNIKNIAIVLKSRQRTRDMDSLFEGSGDGFTAISKRPPEWMFSFEEEVKPENQQIMFTKKNFKVSAVKY